MEEEELTPKGSNELLKYQLESSQQFLKDFYGQDDDSQGTTSSEQTPPNTEQSSDSQPITSTTTDNQEKPNHLIVDGQDISNHDQFEYASLNIPWNEELEGKGPSDQMLDVYDKRGYHKNWKDRLRHFGRDSYYTGPDGQIDLIDNAYQIWLIRKHALTEKGDASVEVSNSIKKASIDLISSILTARERGFDMVTGEMQNVEGQMIRRSTGKPYVPDWDPMGRFGDPHQNSWWGKVLGVGLKYGIAGRWVSKGLGTPGMPLTQRAMISEGIVAGLSEYSQGDNLSGQIVEKAPVLSPIFGALATKDYDHPLVMTFKNVLEEMTIVGGLGKIFARFGGDDGAKRALKAGDNLDQQIKTKGKLELAEEIEYNKTNKALPPKDVDASGQVIDVKPIDTPAVRKARYKSNMRGHKNKPIAEPGQGAPASTGSPTQIYKQLNRIDDFGNEMGSTYSGMTPTEASRASKSSKLSAAFLKKRAKELLSDSEYLKLVAQARKAKVKIGDLYRPAHERVQEIMGRNWQDMSVEEFWEPITKYRKAQTGVGVVTENFDYINVEHVMVMDIVNGSLFKELRDRAIAARELGDAVDPFARDGIMDAIKDKLTFGLANAKRSRFLSSDNLAKFKDQFGNLTAEGKKAIKQRTTQLHGETEEAVDLMMEMLKRRQGDELAEQVLEVFSMQNKVQDWMDFDKWMRSQIVGDGKGWGRPTGVLQDELHSVFVNSALSGTRTPLRAIMGTTSNAYLNSINTFLGAGARVLWTGDTRMLMASARNVQGMLGIIPDSFKVFKASLRSNFGKNVANLETRFSQRTRLNNKRFAAYGQWAEEFGSDADKAAFRIANVARGLNDNRFFSWVPRVLVSVDKTSKYIMAKARSKELAFTSVYDEVAQGKFAEITPELLKAAEDAHYSRYLDEAGDLDISIDPYLQNKFKEVTLTSDLEGITKHLEVFFEKVPQLKPFFLFAKTGVNGLKMNAKHSPIIGALLDESRDILLHSGDDFESLFKYGIHNADDLTRARNLITGRQISGAAIVYLGVQKYLAGELTGNGPANRSRRALWRETRWIRNQMTFGGINVGYDAFEPYNLILSSIADIGDNMEDMGQEWATEWYSRLAYAITANSVNVVDKSYMAGLMNLVELFTPDRKPGKIIAELANTQVPLAGLRADVAKILNPRMRELRKGMFDSIRNRNLTSEHLALTSDGPDARGLPLKYDMLNGEPIRDWNFFERVWNTISPVTLSMKAGPGRTLLWNSQYDLKMSVLSAPGGISLVHEPKIRSLFQKAIGNYRDRFGRNLEEVLDDLAENPVVIASLESMAEDQRRGDYDIEPRKAYPHNDLIKQAFDEARNAAWAALIRSQDTDVLRVIEKKRQTNLKNLDAYKRSRDKAIDIENIRKINNP